MCGPIFHTVLGICEVAADRTRQAAPKIKVNNLVIACKQSFTYENKVCMMYLLDAATQGGSETAKTKQQTTGGRTLIINDPADTENPNPVIGARPDQENEAPRGIL